ncbi:MAG: ATP-binding protein, partial [Bacteroidota bacterium]
IRYRGIQFNYPEGVRYQYRMEGSSNESWIDAGEKREASFFDLAPGSYTFSVKAMNADGFWSDPISLNVTILQPWWWSWSARIAYLLLAIAAAYGFYRFQLSRRLAEAEATRLAELDHVKTRLYTNITHEFRTPLTVIQGMADKVAERPDRFLENGISMIRRNSQQLLRLVNQLLDLAKLESGHLSLNTQAIEINPFLAYLIESFESYAETCQLDLQHHSTLEDLIVEVDPDRLTDILSNLMTNAIKFTPEGGQVSVETHRSRNQLQITVQDTGQGIAAEDLPHIFDRFYQVDSSDTRGGEGTGVGLALTRELVQVMGGKITVESRLNQGSTFRVSLPLKVVEEVAVDAPAFTPLVEPTAIQPSSAPIATGAPHILVVEDNADVAQYIQSCLEGDFRITWAKDGQAGIEQALELIPDLVISDVMMPRKDGFELCYALKHDRTTSHIPVILLTARADADSKLAGLRKGADAYLTKPFDEKELRIRIDNLLALRRTLQERYLSGVEVTEEAPAGFEQEDTFISQFKAVVTERLDDPKLDVSALGMALNLSRTPLHNKLKALTGMSTTEFVRHIRLQHAAELLKEPQYNISEVAHATGFQSPNYFTRRFRELYGVTPKEWREARDAEK